MIKMAWQSAAALLALILLPAIASAQAAITGVVKDASGGVLPGVTVEAASPALIEKVRSVVSDDTGQYRIVDLRPGTYSVTFTLPGFSTVRREGIELSGTFVATVNGDLRVGALEETITVTGETPIVDVQSARTQQTVSKDILAAIPTSRNAAGIQALIPGMNTGTDSGGITGVLTGGAGTIHGGRGDDSRTYADGINMGWAGGSAGGGNMPQVSSSQEVVLTTSGGLGEAETNGVILNVIPREGANTFSGQFAVSGANGSMQGSNFTQELQDAGLRSPSELLKAVRRQPHGRRPDHPRQAVVLYDVPSDRVGADGTGHVVEPERRQPECMVGGFRQEPAGIQRHPRASGHRASDLAGDASQQVQHSLVRAVQQREQDRWGRRHADTRGAGPDALPAVAPAPRHMVVADFEPSADGSRLGHVPGPVPHADAADGRHPSTP